MLPWRIMQSKCREYRHDFSCTSLLHPIFQLVIIDQLRIYICSDYPHRNYARQKLHLISVRLQDDYDHPAGAGTCSTFLKDITREAVTNLYLSLCVQPRDKPDYAMTAAEQWTGVLLVHRHVDAFSRLWLGYIRRQRELVYTILMKEDRTASGASR